MEVFELHKDIIGDYQSYIDSFINIADQDIQETVSQELESGKLWPEPLIQFNPAFEAHSSIDKLTEDGILHAKLKDIFSGYTLYRHQVEAMKLGAQEKDFIVTSGTGSGKSLTYIGTIFNYLIKNSSELKPGVKAVIVYPMNALINSQTEEFRKYAHNYKSATGEDFPITFGQYTGQEDEDTRKRMRENLPDILLTNYMMLELLLSRDSDKKIKESLYEHLRFLVFDELHTYRGRQGSDVALLIRRIKSQCKNTLACIGTSATMVSGAGSIESQKGEVASVASTIFGNTFDISQIINETLASSFGGNPHSPEKDELSVTVAKDDISSLAANSLDKHPVARWLEAEVALDTQKCESNGEEVFIRRKPMTLAEVASVLAASSSQPKDQCAGYLKRFLKRLSEINLEISSQEAGDTFLPFKLHQFISQTGSVYITLDPQGKRQITLEPGIYAGGTDGKRPLFPVVFSRQSGASFVCATLNTEAGMLEPREFRTASTDDQDENASSDGYLILDVDSWNPEEDMENLPEAWLKRDKSGVITGPVKKYASRFPVRVQFNVQGEFAFDATPSERYPHSGWFMAERLLFDPTSGTFFDTKTSEGTKLTQLGSEGRATSTTITTFAILTGMAAHDFRIKDQKLLSFTDNRQDAALQAGHFNDFMSVVRLRAAICKALTTAENNCLTYSSLGPAVMKALDLPFTEYAVLDKEPRFGNQRREFDEALQTLLVYRALYDLRRSWRVILPNLEQCGLLRVDYQDLDEICSDPHAWDETILVSQMPVDKRKEFIFNILEYFRLSYAISSENYLTHERIQHNRKEITEKLRSPWKFEENEEIPVPYHLRFTTLARHQQNYTASIGVQSRLGKYIRYVAAEYGLEFEFKGSHYEANVRSLMDLLCEVYLKSVPMKDKNKEDVPVYQLRIDRVLWRLGDGKVHRDIFSSRSYKDYEVKPNLYFKQVYQMDFSTMKKLVSADHTGQLTNDDRKDRERDFRADFYLDGDAKELDLNRIRSNSISALYCSPTMELGIDISNLSIVHMRNAPPNPANYAQRSGRAGRSGQAALVFTYCSSYSSHDRHYFKHARELVAGAVAAPRIDLFNQDLLRNHLYALVLSEVGLPELRKSLQNLVLREDFPALPLMEEIRERLTLSVSTKDKIKNTFRRVIRDFKDELKGPRYSWFTDSWIDLTLNDTIDNLDTALDRWRSLYQNAMQLLESSTDKLKSGLYPVGSKENKLQKANQHQAQRQIDLLKNDATGMRGQLSEFYPYRYLAAEGFLPGYNFTRLPLRVYIPKGDAGEYISRPRAIALREFGPENRIYHSGNKYIIRQMVVQDAENRIGKAKVCTSSGYMLTGESYDLEHCPFTGASMQANSEKDILLHLLPMSESTAEQMDRISCEEEERISQGYEIDTYFSVDNHDMDRVVKAHLKSGDDHYLNLSYIPAARMCYLNRKWRSTNLQGFPLGLTSGLWKRRGQMEKQKSTDEERETVRNVMLYTTDVADAVYLEPIAPLGLDRNGIITLQYALKRAIENVSQIESSEIGVQSMGGMDDKPNIFIYEAAEGSLGILSRFVDDPKAFREVIEEAVNVCRFDEDPDIPAAYDDLLSYYNQRYHKIIDRFLIQDALEKLLLCNIEVQSNTSYADYDSHYQSMKDALDQNSSTEREFIDYLYKQGLRLPDAAQVQVPNVYVQPDFFYEPDIYVFCDGTPHDKASVAEDDSEKRQILRAMGFKVLVYYYQDDLAKLIASRPDIFKKVK